MIIGIDLTIMIIRFILDNNIYGILKDNKIIWDR